MERLVFAEMKVVYGASGFECSAFGIFPLDPFYRGGLVVASWIFKDYGPSDDWEYNGAAGL